MGQGYASKTLFGFEGPYERCPLEAVAHCRVAHGVHRSSDRVVHGLWICRTQRVLFEQLVRTAHVRVDPQFGDALVDQVVECPERVVLDDMGHLGQKIPPQGFARRPGVDQLQHWTAVRLLEDQHGIRVDGNEQEGEGQKGGQQGLHVGFLTGKVREENTLLN